MGRCPGTEPYKVAHPRGWLPNLPRPPTAEDGVEVSVEINLLLKAGPFWGAGVEGNDVDHVGDILLLLQSVLRQDDSSCVLVEDGETSRTMRGASVGARSGMFGFRLFCCSWPLSWPS